MYVFFAQLLQLCSPGEMHLQPMTGWSSVDSYVCALVYFSDPTWFHLQVGRPDFQ